MCVVVQSTVHCIIEFISLPCLVQAIFIILAYLCNVHIHV